MKTIFGKPFLSQDLRRDGRVLLFVAAFLGIGGTAQAQLSFSTLKYCPSDPPTSFSGQATYYTLCCTFACSYASQAFGQYYCAVSSAGANNIWSSSGACGACIQANYAAGGTSVIVQVVDSCPSCTGPDDLDLSQTAFSTLASTSLGRINISWNFVECPLSILNANAASGGNITYFYKDGETSGIFFEDYLFPIVSVVTGKGESLTHSTDNRWQSASGYFGYSANAVMPVTITDARGNKVNASVTLTTGTGSCVGALNPCYTSVTGGEPMLPPVFSSPVAWRRRRPLRPRPPRRPVPRR